MAEPSMLEMAFRISVRIRPRFEQAFSNDGGKIWETNWVMTFTRVKDESPRQNSRRSGLRLKH